MKYTKEQDVLTELITIKLFEIYADIERLGKVCTQHRCYTKEEFKNALETDANICGVANLIRKGMIKVDNVNEILKPGFEFYGFLVEKLKKDIGWISLENTSKNFIQTLQTI